MNNAIEIQLNLAHAALSEASAQNLLDRAKFGLGLVAGAVSAAVPEEDRHTVLRIAMDGSMERSVDAVLDAAAYLMRMGHNI